MSEHRPPDNRHDVIRISGIRYEEPVGKRIDLAKDNARLEKSPLLEARSTLGEAIDEEFFSLKEFFEYRRKLDAHCMLFSGTFPQEDGQKFVVPKNVLDDPQNSEWRHQLHAATKDFLEHRDQPSILMIDIDRKEPESVAQIWPESPTVFDTPEQVRDAIHEILPEAMGVPIIVLPSSSSMIARVSDGKLLTGPGGWRVYIPIADGREIPEVLKTIHARCWARNRYNFAFISKGGAFLHRSLADMALARPTQPDYPSADLGEGLERVSKYDCGFDLEGHFLDGGAVKLSEADRVAASDALAEVRALLKPEAVEIRNSRIKEEVKRAVERGVQQKQAEQTVRRKFEDEVLLSPEIIRFANGKEVSIEDLLLSRGQDFDRMICCDPIEPDYNGGRLVAKFFWNDGRVPVIHSFAHGDTDFYPRFDFQSALEAIGKSAQDDRQIYRILALSKDGTTSTEYERLESRAATALGLGNKRKGLRREVNNLYRPIPQRGPNDIECFGTITEPQSLDRSLDPSSFPKNQLNDSGAIRILDHQDNIRYLLQNYGIKMRYNEITKDLEWEHPDIAPRGDNAENSLRSMLVGLCSLNNVPIRELDTHLTALGNASTYNPVVDFLCQLNWDHDSRFDRLAEKMDADNPEVARIAIRIFFIQACAAADHAERAKSQNSGYESHFESVVVFAGEQGLGKTRGVRALLPGRLRSFYKEGVTLDVKNKDLVKAAVSNWIVELGELESTFRKSDIEHLKAFLSLSVDEIRMPYARKASKFSRRTAFVGTVNDMEFLADQTGNRRFIPLVVSQPVIDWSDEEIDQLWAEAWCRYCSGEKWWPDESEAALLAVNAESHRAKTSLEEDLENWYEWGATPDFKAGRKTATQIAREILDDCRADIEIRVSKTIGAALRRLWKDSGVAEFRHGKWLVQKPEGDWVPVDAKGGKKRGWLLPPRKHSLSNLPSGRFRVENESGAGAVDEESKRNLLSQPRR
ncbi:MAG: hypothetical protein GY798_08575 [Hyphomicrobiales bacterium]|nr:hypothetical protein [Hyphomicrobiales bacterium]